MNGTVATFVDNFQEWLTPHLKSSCVVLVFDKYFDYSPKSSARATRAESVRYHKLGLDTPLPTRDAVLKCVANKQQLADLICQGLLSDSEFLSRNTSTTELVIAGWIQIQSL